MYLDLVQRNSYRTRVYQHINFSDVKNKVDPPVDNNGNEAVCPSYIAVAHCQVCHQPDSPLMVQTVLIYINFDTFVSRVPILTSSYVSAEP